MRAFWRQLGWLLPTWLLLVFAVFGPQSTFAYDYSSQDNLAYGISGRSAVEYDEDPNHRSGDENRALEERALFLAKSLNLRPQRVERLWREHWAKRARTRWNYRPESWNTDTWFGDYAFSRSTHKYDLNRVKNVQSLSFTRQLRDYSAFAQQNGLQFNLYVRPTTILSGPL